MYGDVQVSRRHHHEKFVNYNKKISYGKPLIAVKFKIKTKLSGK